MTTSFELHTTYTLTTEIGAITPQGKDLIQAAIVTIDMMTSKEWKELNPDNTRQFLLPLPDVDKFAWFWMVQKGEYRGTFAKRVAQYYKKELGLYCPKSFIEKIGNIARQHSLEAFTYQFDFTNVFDWDDGDYGDSGSCYWGGNNEARDALANAGGLAIRFSDNSGGYARAWLYETDNFYVVFNGYGLTTLEIAKIFATWLGVDYKKINLNNRGVSSGLIWINGGSGYVVGGNIKDVSHYNLDIYTPNCCARCGEDMGDDTYTGADDEDYCRDCYYEYFSRCDECDEVYNSDNVYYVESSEVDVCESCLNRHYTTCEYCGEYWQNSRIDEDKEGRARCEGCSDKD